MAWPASDPLTGFKFNVPESVTDLLTAAAAVAAAAAAAAYLPLAPLIITYRSPRLYYP